MVTRKTLMIFVLCLALGALQVPAEQTRAAGEAAGDAVIVMIDKTKSAGISPNPAKVKLGQTVIWLNRDFEPITIEFKTRLGLACKAPVNFYADLLGNYETGTIIQGGTASICFIEKGEYVYEVKRLAGEKEKDLYEETVQGKIIVE